MAKLALVYGMRLVPADELVPPCGIGDATIQFKGGRQGRVTMHLIEGNLEEIKKTFESSVGAFFEFYPEI